MLQIPALFAYVHKKSAVSYYLVDFFSSFFFTAITEDAEVKQFTYCAQAALVRTRLDKTHSESVAVAQDLLNNFSHESYLLGACFNSLNYFWTYSFDFAEILDF